MAAPGPATQPAPSQQPQPQQPAVEDPLVQLHAARRLVLQDPAYWPQVFQGTLPIISPPFGSSAIEVKRWGADFLAETFSTPIVEAKIKNELALQCLDTLLALSREREAGILKSVVQCSACVYPIVFRYICTNRNDAATWTKVSEIKSKILSLWDAAPTGVRIACTKFVQRVVLVQSRGLSDPRLIDKSDTSLVLVPTNHPLLEVTTLDAQGQGLLDRLLSILHEDPSDPSLVTATLNNLSAIIKSRPPLAPKVIQAVMSFNPLAGASRGLTVANRLMMVSMEKTARVLLVNVLRSNPQGPYVQRIQQHLHRMTQAKAELAEEASRKRAAPSDFETAKRAKIEKLTAASSAKGTPEPPQPNPTPAQQVISGPLTYAQLYTLATDPAMTTFDGQQLPIELVIQIVLGSLMRADSKALEAAVAEIRARYAALLASQSRPSVSQSQNSASTGSSLSVPGAVAPSPNAVASAASAKEVHLELGEFRLPAPPALSSASLRDTALKAIDRMFAAIDSFDKTSLIARKSKLGVNRLAAANWDREGWVTLIARYATRAAATQEAADAVRDRLFQYVTADFRARMDVATAWLNEEWYHDRVMAEREAAQAAEGENKPAVLPAPVPADDDMDDAYDPESSVPPEDNKVAVKQEETPRYAPQYEKWMMQLMDAIFPFVEAKDRTFLRMLSEIPEVTPELLAMVRGLCLDPDRTSLGVQMLHYLVMLRPPVREMCLTIVEDLYWNHPELQRLVLKILQRWRPQALQQRIEVEPNIKKEEGSATPAPPPSTIPSAGAADAQLKSEQNGSPTAPVAA